MVPSEEAQRQRCFNNLLNALRPFPSERVPTHGTFAACETINPYQEFSLKCFHVEGIGELQLPLSGEDASKLRNFCEQRSTGKSSAAVLDKNMQCSWQLDASKVTFPGEPTFLSNTVQALAMKAVCALGLDPAGVQLEAGFYKFLCYEVGGPFTFHRDPEKEKGVFASLVLQLPTEQGYTGGKLVVKHKSKKKEFEGHMVSAIGFCYTIFSADCIHKVREIKSGTRICLAFNLVRCDSSFDSIYKKFIPDRLNKVEAALEPWLKEATTGRRTVFGRILYIPLQHKYTEEHLSFHGLKLEDSIVAELLKECKDKNGKQWLDLHLCLATKFKVDRESTYGYHNRYREIDEEENDNFETKNWIGSDGSEVLVNNLGLDVKKELVVGEEEDPFHSEPDEGDYPADSHDWDHTAMLVAWPKVDSFIRACDASASRALDILEKMYEIGDSDLCKQLSQFVSYCKRNPFKIWEVRRDSTEDNVTPRVLKLCTRANVLEEVWSILYLLASSLPDYVGDSGRKVGVRNAEVVKAIANSVQVFGWESVSLPIIKLTKNCGSTQSESFAQLAEQLKCTGNMDACVQVANTASLVVKARIRELESHKMPEFTWCQPLAKLPGNLEVEEFLKGPQERYVLRGFFNLGKARDFCTLHFNDREWKHSAGYSAVAGEGGRGREAFCEIKKTRRLFEFSLDQWQKEQKSIERLRLDLGKLRSAVAKTNSAPASAVPIQSGNGDNKRQRLNTDVTGGTTDVATSSTIEIIDLSAYERSVGG